MTNDAGNLSIDFLAGFTIFIIAFIYVATMIPGLFIDLQSRTIDYDAVAYRTGVILTEDPGMPYNPAWDLKTDAQKADVLRFGLALSKDTPGILSSAKINRFFCSTWTADDYRSRAIFGDYPYQFNISLKRMNNNIVNSTGDTPPDEHGYIRRVVKVKGDSNATINSTMIKDTFHSVDNATTDQFSIFLNITGLLSDETNPAYQIDPFNDQIMVNISGMSASVNYSDTNYSYTNLTSICIGKWMPLPSAANPTINPCFRTINTTIVDGNTVTLPYTVQNTTYQSNISLVIPPGFISSGSSGMADETSHLYFNLTFDHYDSSGNATYEKGYLNSTLSGPFNYNYTNKNVTLPSLQDGVLEVSVW